MASLHSRYLYLIIVKHCSLLFSVKVDNLQNKPDRILNKVVMNIQLGSNLSPFCSFTNNFSLTV